MDILLITLNFFVIFGLAVVIYYNIKNSKDRNQINTLQENQNKKKIESLEKKLINNMEEKAYTELLKLKSQINRE